jgi:predicted DCC family thiol-disulfide oxidoreductase YuxK
MTSRPQHTPTEPRVGWVLYDGDCGVCSRWVPSWAPTLAPRGIAVAPLQSSWVGQRTGLTETELTTDIRFLGANGTLLSGAEVYRYLMRQFWWSYPLYLLSRIPVLSLVFEWGYRNFARHRMHISATCGLKRTHG